MSVKELARSTKLVYGGYSQMASKFTKEMLDSIVNNKSVIKTKKSELAELTSIKIDFILEKCLRAANILVFVNTDEYLSDIETIAVPNATKQYYPEKS